MVIPWAWHGSVLSAWEKSELGGGSLAEEDGCDRLDWSKGIGILLNNHLRLEMIFWLFNLSHQMVQLQHFIYRGWESNWKSDKVYLQWWLLEQSVHFPPIAFCCVSVAQNQATSLWIITRGILECVAASWSIAYTRSVKLSATLCRVCRLGWLKAWVKSVEIWPNDKLVASDEQADMVIW